MPFLLALIALLLAGPALADDGVAAANDECLACHSDPELTTTLEDGHVRKLTVDGEAYARSKHAGKRCTECHPGFENQPHPDWNLKTQAAYRNGFRDACTKCHPQQHAQAEGGVHFQLWAKGDERAPFCTDCHGVHDITEPSQPRQRISRTCGACHGEILAAYAKSVHGHALLAGSDPDVPVCTDCHRSHDIKDPRTRAWQLGTPDTCGRCHGNPEIAKRHGMSPNVVRTYLADFHGVTASLQKTHPEAQGGAVTALCVDCHGVHDIVKVDDPASPVVRGRVVQTCRKCHADADPSFPAAWLSHYDPSFERFPLLAGVLAFYRLIVPYVVGGLALQVLIHLWSVLRGGHS